MLVINLWLSSAWCLLSCFPPLTSTQSWEMAAPPWAWFCHSSLAVERELFLPAVAKFLLIRGSSNWKPWTITVRFFPYNINCLESTVVVIWQYISWNEFLAPFAKNSRVRKHSSSCLSWTVSFMIVHNKIFTKCSILILLFSHSRSTVIEMCTVNLYPGVRLLMRTLL